MAPVNERSTIGLVLTGGGARAAYQVGALRALEQLVGSAGAPGPFAVLSGSSAGSINVATLASHASSFTQGVEQLWSTWASLTPQQVYRTDPASLMTIGSRWLKELGGGGVFGEGINYLLDTSPLRALLREKLHLERLPEYFARGCLRGVSISSTNYQSGTAITFFDGVSTLEPWTRSIRLGLRDTLTVEHVMASSAIPIFFPPVRLNHSFYGDGCIRLTSPLSPAIHLGAHKILAIGVRYLRTADQTAQLNRTIHEEAPAISEISGVLLNAVFLDSLESDVERLERINRTLALMSSEQRARLSQPLRPVPILVLRPSQDLGTLAEHQHRHLPKGLRYLLQGLGVTRKGGGDLLSYLAFEPEYINKLLALGYQDTMRRSAEIAIFLKLPD